MLLVQIVVTLFIFLVAYYCQEIQQIHICLPLSQVTHLFSLSIRSVLLNGYGACLH